MALIYLFLFVLLTILITNLKSMLLKKKMVSENKSEDEIKVNRLLKENAEGLTITELANKTRINRSRIRITLARLEGGEKVSIKKVGMAKLYSIK